MKIYQVPSGTTRFPCMHDLTGNCEWVDLREQGGVVTGTCICGKTFWWKEGQDDEKLNQV